MYQYYPSGGSIAIHQDTIEEVMEMNCETHRNLPRLLTLILYLCDEWQEGDGGELLLYHNNQTIT